MVRSKVGTARLAAFVRRGPLYPKVKRVEWENEPRMLRTAQHGFRNLGLWSDGTPANPQRKG